VNKFLIIQTAFLGDVILCTPVISELKRIYPNSSIDVLVKSGNEILLENNLAVRHVLSFEKNKNKLRAIYKLLKIIRQNKYDEVINLHRFASSGILTVLSGANSKVGFKKNPFSFLYSKKINHSLFENLHEVERNLKCISHHNANLLIKPTIYPASKDYEKVQTYKKTKYYCFAPASIWFTKQLPEIKWVELAKQISKKGQIYLIGGTNDFALCQNIKNKLIGLNIENLAGKLTLLQSAALMKDSEMNFVNDSAPMHLCSAVNAPVTSFFCSTIPNFGFGPLSDNSKVIQIDYNLPCRPCGIHGFKSCPKEHFKCGNDIHISLLD
jgi:ADP-heptose:LPS heptosyltransferase